MMWSQHHKILTLLLGFATALGQIASDSSAVRKIGPIINDLPVLDSLIVADDSTAKKKVSAAFKNQSRSIQGNGT